MPEKVEPTPIPVGTIEKIVENNCSPAEWGSCAPQNLNHPQHGDVKGCPFYANCQFEKDRPRNFLMYFEDQNGNNQFMPISCWNWMGVWASRAKDQLARNEVIELVGEEGDVYDETVTLPVDPNNNVSGNLTMKTIVRKAVVPKYPEPGEEGSKIPPGYADRNKMRGKGMAGRKKAKIRKELNPVYMGPSADEITAAFPMPVVEPEKRGPGRPRKAENEPA